MTLQGRPSGSGIEDGPEVPEVQRQHNVQRTVRLRRVGVVTGHSIIRTGEKHTNKDKLHTTSTRRAVQTTCQQSSLLEPSNLVRKQVKDAETHLLELRTRVSRVLDLPRAQSHQPIAALVIVICCTTKYDSISYHYSHRFSQFYSTIHVMPLPCRCWLHGCWLILVRVFFTGPYSYDL